MAQLRSGQIVVETAGTAVAGPDLSAQDFRPGVTFLLKAHPDNTDTVWWGNDGSDDVDADTGYPLNPGETCVVVISNLNKLYFDADVNGEKFCWSVV